MEGEGNRDLKCDNVFNKLCRGSFLKYVLVRRKHFFVYHPPPPPPSPPLLFRINSGLPWIVLVFLS